MQVTETNAEGLKREYKIVVDAQEIDEKVQVRLKEIGQNARIPGFRPGRAPMTILRQRFGQAVLGEILERAVNDSSKQALEEKGVRPAQQPQIEVESFDEGKDLEYKMSLELLPEIEPMDFARIELERLKVKVPEEEVDQAIERLAEQHKETKPIETPRPSQNGDVLVVDFKGTVDGEAFPGMEAEDHHLELGANRFIEGFEEQLTGASADETREVRVTFPEGYANEQLSGKEAVFEVKVKEIREPQPLSIDDSLAEKFGEENLDGLKQKVREHLAQDYDRVARARVKRELLDKLSENHDFDVPPTMVEQEFQQIWHQIEHDREQGRLDAEDADKSEEELRKDYGAIAERRVRLGLLLSEVGRRNNLDVSQEELNQALVQEVQRYPGHEREVFEHYQKNPQALQQLRAPLYEDKVVDYILELANVTEREVSPDELHKELGQGTDDEASGNEAPQDEAGASEAGDEAGKTKKTTKGKSSGKSKKAKSAATEQTSDDSA